jgi:hypothetical protein
MEGDHALPARVAGIMASTNFSPSCLRRPTFVRMCIAQLSRLTTVFLHASKVLKSVAVKLRIEIKF